MIPNWHLTTVWLGPIPIQVWGFFVALGFAVAIWLTVKRAPRVGVDPKDVVDFAVWAIVASMVGGRLLHVLEEFSYYSQHPLDMLAVWNGGLSSYGGFIGAVVAGWWFVRRRQRVSFRAQRGIPHPGGRDPSPAAQDDTFWRFADLLAVHLPLGWFIGRLGCYSTHLHAGISCNGAFCVPFPDGTRRLDMGLLDGLGMLAIYPILLWLSRKPRPPGALIGVLSAWYGLQRFLLDFLRATPDVLAGTSKYAGLTLAQYLSILLFVFGIVMLWRARAIGDGAHA